MPTEPYDYDSHQNMERAERFAKAAEQIAAAETLGVERVSVRSSAWVEDDEAEELSSSPRAEMADFAAAIRVARPAIETFTDEALMLVYLTYGNQCLKSSTVRDELP